MPLSMIVIEGVCSLGDFFHKYTSIMRHKNSFFFLCALSINMGQTHIRLFLEKLEEAQKTSWKHFKSHNFKRKRKREKNSNQGIQEKGIVWCKKMRHPHTHIRMYKIVRGKQFNKDPLFALCLFHLSIIFLGSAKNSPNNHILLRSLFLLYVGYASSLALLPKKKCVFTANSWRWACLVCFMTTSREGN